ncbi:hypothetical protein PALB_37870 [Pseudoalteromonas luteoviolacea B = ATCC 29581]|nr:hypothetical protein PALB_37870 [Pseudoalteromonas luteoviolacea B = ATCC 29581]
MIFHTTFALGNVEIVRSFDLFWLFFGQVVLFIRKNATNFE